MGVYSTVPCEEVHGSKKEGGDPFGFTASVKLRCLYADRFTLADDLVNNGVWPDFTGAKVKTIAMEPDFAKYTTSGQECVYEHTLLTINYSSREDADVISESIEPTAEFRLLDHRLFRWSSGTGALLNEKEAPGQIIRGLNLVRTLYRQSSVPASILTLPGKCSNAIYTSSLLGLTFAAETLLFMPGSITRQIKLSGSPGFNVTVKMSYKPSGWNKFWRQSTGTYESIYAAGGAEYKPYPPASFSDWLF